MATLNEMIDNLPESAQNLIKRGNDSTYSKHSAVKPSILHRTTSAHPYSVMLPNYSSVTASSQVGVITSYTLPCGETRIAVPYQYNCWAIFTGSASTTSACGNIDIFKESIRIGAHKYGASLSSLHAELSKATDSKTFPIE